MRDRDIAQRGVTVIDVVIVLALVAALTFVATFEFPRYTHVGTPAPTAAPE